MFGLLQSGLIVIGALHVFPSSVERTISILVQPRKETCVYVKYMWCGLAGSTAIDGLSANSVLPSSASTCCGSLQVFPPSVENDIDGPINALRTPNARGFKIHAY